MTIKICVDDEIFSLQDKFGGISKVISNHINFFKDSKTIKFILPFDYSNNIHLQSTNFKKKNFLKNFATYKKYKIIRFLNKKKTLSFIKNSRYDILHLSYMDLKYLNINTKPSLGVIHDLIPEKNSKYFKNLDLYIKKKERVINKLDHIIAVSNETKKDIINYYRINEDKITVIYNSIFTKKRKSVELPEKFILYVGNRNGYKHFKTLKNILPELIKNTHYKLICAGGENVSAEERNYINKNNLEKKIIFKNFTDEELNYVYFKAKCLVITSIAEGFGQNIIEAQLNKCPIICSDIPIFREIASKYAIYFKKKNSNDLLKKINNLLNYGYNPMLINNKNLERFNPIKQKKKLIKVYKKLI